MKHSDQIWTATIWDLIFSYEYSLLHMQNQLLFLLEMVA